LQTEIDPILKKVIEDLAHYLDAVDAPTKIRWEPIDGPEYSYHRVIGGIGGLIHHIKQTDSRLFEIEKKLGIRAD